MDGEERASGRLDNFVDGAFAFAVTLLVIAEGGMAISYDDLLDAMRRLPAFLFGFALIANFWLAHLSWRRAGGRSDTTAILLSLTLVFTVLVYVHPLRLLVVELVTFMRGETRLGVREASGMFTIYGLGFAAMSALIALLFRHSQRAGDLPADNTAMVTWGAAAAVGLLSALIAQMPFPIMFFAGWAYWLLPLLVVLNSSLKRRRNLPALESGNEIK